MCPPTRVTQAGSIRQREPITLAVRAAAPGNQPADARPQRFTVPTRAAVPSVLHRYAERLPNRNGPALFSEGAGFAC